MPEDPRMLLETLRWTLLWTHLGGKYAYFGLVDGMQRIPESFTEVLHADVKLQLHVDGLAA